MNEQTAISSRAVAKLAAGAPINAIVPTTIEEVFRLAELIKQSDLAPYQLKTPQAVAVVLLKGLEIGLPPMAALECIGVINNKACLHSDGIPALLWSRGFKIKEWYENEDAIDKIVAHCEITRPDGDKYTFKYSAQDAKDNGLWDTREKNHKGEANKSPWFLFKKRMVRMRCRGWLARDCASDVLKGIPIFEEQQDIELSRTEYREISTLPDIPDIPDIEADTIGEEHQQSRPAEADNEADTPLADEAGFLKHIEEELASTDDFEIRQEIWDANADLIGRLSEAGQKRLAKLRPVSEAAE